MKHSATLRPAAVLLCRMGVRRRFRGLVDQPAGIRWEREHVRNIAQPTTNLLAIDMDDRS
ncbi:hypothetical protein ACFFJT_14725 [Dyella flava]|uniref:hypothetical protein n=1 Tax=Dyella flava TaxID=1920170 RepID=UPI001956368F|nr:hypothetical protein [Dyella flava]